MANMLEAALGYLRRGYPIIPVKPAKPSEERIPYVKWSKYQTVLPDEGTVKIWWEQWPHANIAIVTGKLSGLIVMDVDPERGGSANVLPPTDMVVNTSRGGTHHYYLYPEGGCGKWVGGNGIDVLGDGGLAHVPPSIHSTGEPYVWDPDEDPGVIDMETIVKVAPRSNGSASLSKTGQGDWIAHVGKEGVDEGNRNDSLARWAGYAARNTKLDIEEFTNEMQVWNEENCNPPLPRREVARTAQSIYRAELKSSTDTKSKKHQKPVTGPAPPLTEAELDEGALLPTITLSKYAIKYGGRTTEWLIPGYLPERSIAFIYGPPGSYKTWLEFDMAVSLASGLPFLGQSTSMPRRKGPILILQQEDNHEAIAERIFTIWMARLGVSEPTIDGDDINVDIPDTSIFDNIHMYEERGFRFDNPDMVAKLERLVRKLRPIAVFFDPMYSLVPMDDYMIEAASYMRPLKIMRDRYDTTFIIVHHTTKASLGTGSRQGMMGSQFINAYREAGMSVSPVTGTKGSIVMKRDTKSAGIRSDLRIDYDIFDGSSDEPGEWRFNTRVREISGFEFRRLADPEQESDEAEEEDHSPQQSDEERFRSRLKELPDGMPPNEAESFPQFMIERLVKGGDVKLAGNNLCLTHGP